MTIKKIPMRQCCGCRTMGNKKDMIRVIRTPEGEVVLDTTGRQNGRGAYICPTMDCLLAAIKNRGIERSLNVSIPKEVTELLIEEMKKIDR